MRFVRDRQTFELQPGVEFAVLSFFGDVIVHIDPETHGDHSQLVAHHNELPERIELLKNIKQQWQELLSEDDIENIDLHYLERGIEVDLTVSLEEISDQLAVELERALFLFDYITSLRIYCKLYETNLDQRLS